MGESNKHFDEDDFSIVVRSNGLKYILTNFVENILIKNNFLNI